jgi:hypothetical protein
MIISSFVLSFLSLFSIRMHFKGFIMLLSRLHINVIIGAFIHGISTYHKS